MNKLNEQEQQALIEELISYPKESEWLEFKKNNSKPNEIGEYISALSNSACLTGHDFAYLVFGVVDSTHSLCGTNFKPSSEKIGNQELENWLATQLDPKIDFEIYEFAIDARSFAIFKIDAAKSRPTRFKNIAHIRVGSYKKKLKDHSEKERKIWSKTSGINFENEIAKAYLTDQQIFNTLDYQSYYRLQNIEIPISTDEILNRFSEEQLINRNEDRWDITNLGAILFANRLNDFTHLKRKRIRVIIYDGKNKLNTIKEQVGVKGYASGFEGLINWITDQLPQNEVISKALREKVTMYPEIAIRELVANALIHQDFDVKGTNPMIEIYSSRIVIINNGKPLIEPLRFMSGIPKSRNEDLASLMRRLNICEERGSGITKAIHSVEVFQLPPLDFRVDENLGVTMSTIFAHKDLKRMTKDERIHACYQHACLKYASREKMSNKTLRERFKIAEKNYSKASRIIAETIEEGLIKDKNPDSNSKKHASYIPFWA